MDFSIVLFLEENEKELIEGLKDHFHRNLEQRLMFSGHYREAYDTKLKLRMRARIMYDIGTQFNLDPEQQLLLESDRLDNIINRSIYE